MASGWHVVDHPDFADEREHLPRAVKVKLAAVLIALVEVGPIWAGRWSIR